MGFGIIGSLPKAFNHKFLDLVDALIRNPCFHSYFIKFFRMLCTRPSLLSLVLILVTLTIYHKWFSKKSAITRVYTAANMKNIKKYWLVFAAVLIHIV